MNPLENQPRRKKARCGVSFSIEADDEPACNAIEVEYSGTGNREHVPVPALVIPRTEPAAACCVAGGATPDQALDEGVALDGDAPSVGQGGLQDVPPKRRSRWKPPSAQMAEFKERQLDTLDILFRNEYDPRSSLECECGSHKMRTYRCRDCFVLDPCCVDCMKASHAHAPFHHIEAWSGDCFTRSSLYALDYELCLGHNGRRCPHVPKALQPALVMVHTNGVHRVRVCFCECAPRPTNPIQLLRASLYPATWTNTATPFSIAVLKHYHLDSLQSRKPAYDYWAILRRLTDNTRVSPVPDRYEDLLRVSREWRILVLLKRSGQALGISEFLPDQSTSVAVLCPACPKPGLNLPDGWEKQVTAKNRHEYTVFLGVDGNYHAVLKEKRHDHNDVPLLDGRGYFTNTKQYDDYLTANSKDAPSEHKSDCADLTSMKSITQRKGLKVAGIAAVFDVRHSMYMPGSMVDLEVGEKFRVLDYALAQALGPNPPVELHRVLTCDKGCQYVVHLVERFTNAFPALAPVVERLKVLVPKLHLQGHNEDCRYRYSLNYTPGCGRTDGEGVERPWYQSNDTAKITRDQNPGHRKDTYNDCNNGWNYGKLIDMAHAIVGRLKSCYKDLAVARENFEALSRAIPADRRAGWEKLSCEPNVNKKTGVVKSVYRPDRVKLPSYKELVDALKRADEQAATNILDSTLNKIYCLTNFVSAGLDLEESQMSLKFFIDDLPDEITPVQEHAIFTRRYNLREALTTFRALQQVHMPRLGPAPSTVDFECNDDKDFGCPEDEPLDLPSSFGDDKERERYGFVDAGRREYALRMGLADESLARMRVAIHAYNAVVTFKKANVTGQRQGTRAGTKVDARVKDVHRWRDAYRCHHRALVTLGLTAEDALKYRPLVDDDLKNLYTHSALHPRRLGKGREHAAWFWGGDRDPDDVAVTDMDALTEEEIRTRWFRLRANLHRYEEEVDILRAELGRTLATFKRMRAIWELVAARQVEPETPGPKRRSAETWLGRRAYASKQASIHAQRVHDAETNAARAAQMKEAPPSAQKRTADRQRKQSGTWDYKWSFY